MTVEKIDIKREIGSRKGAIYGLVSSVIALLVTVVMTIVAYNSIEAKALYSVYSIMTDFGLIMLMPCKFIVNLLEWRADDSKDTITLVEHMSSLVMYAFVSYLLMQYPVCNLLLGHIDTETYIMLNIIFIYGLWGCFLGLVKDGDETKNKVSSIPNFIAAAITFTGTAAILFGIIQSGVLYYEEIC